MCTRVNGGLLGRHVWWPPPAREVWSLHTSIAPRSGYGGSFICAPRGIDSLFRPVTPGDSHLHRVSGRRGAHEYSAFYLLYICGFAAVVSGPGLRRPEARGTVEQRRDAKDLVSP